MKQPCSPVPIRYSERQIPRDFFLCQNAHGAAFSIAFTFASCSMLFYNCIEKWKSSEKHFHGIEYK